MSADDKPIGFNQKVGPMILDLGYHGDNGQHVSPVFFDAVVENGVLAVPSLSTVSL